MITQKPMMKVKTICKKYVAQMTWWGTPLTGKTVEDQWCYYGNPFEKDFVFLGYYIDTTSRTNSKVLVFTYKGTFYRSSAWNHEVETLILTDLGQLFLD